MFIFWSGRASYQHTLLTQTQHTNKQTPTKHNSGEYAGAIVYAAELAPPGHRFKSAGAIAVGGQLGMAAGSLFVLVLAVVMSAGVSAREQRSVCVGGRGGCVGVRARVCARSSSTHTLSNFAGKRETTTQTAEGQPR